MIQGICGRTFIASSVPAGPLSSWESRLRERLAMVGSTESALIWREKVTPANQLLYQLVPLTPRTFAVEFGLWRTCTAGDGTHNHKATSPSQLTKKTTLMLTVQAQVSEGKVRGHLNPEWVEWLMGFPEGWTNLD